MGLDVFSLNGKTAIVTGASRGLGEASALAISEAGADLVLASRDEERLGIVADKIRSKGSRCITIRVDVLKAKDIQSMVDEALS